MTNKTLDQRVVIVTGAAGDLANAMARAFALAGARLFSVETGGSRPYSAAVFQPGDALIFCSERRGLPAAVLATVPSERQLEIPMRAGNRSLNLANAVAIVVYEAWRQNGFAGAAPRA